MFQDIGEPEVILRDSSSIKEIDNNRYTQVESDSLYNPIEGIKEETKEEDKENKNEENLPEIKKSINTKQKDIKNLKVILLGEKGVGKSSLIEKYVNNKFFSFEKKSIGSEINTKKIEVDDNTIAELSIYDTVNEEKLNKITKKYYRDAHGAVIVFDLTNKKSFKKVKHWLKETHSNAPRDIVLCLLGNKADLESDREVELEEAKEIADDNLYYEVSAKNGNNVSLAFEQLTFEIIEKQNEEEGNPDKVKRGREGRKTADLNDINMINKDLFRKKKCC